MIYGLGSLSWEPSPIQGINFSETCRIRSSCNHPDLQNKTFYKTINFYSSETEILETFLLKVNYLDCSLYSPVHHTIPWRYLSLIAGICTEVWQARIVADIIPCKPYNIFENFWQNLFLFQERGRTACQYDTQQGIQCGMSRYMTQLL